MIVIAGAGNSPLVLQLHENCFDLSAGGGMAD